MTTEDKDAVTKRLVKIKSLCEQAADGQHKWVPKEGYLVCAHCGETTTEKLLFD